MKIGNTPMQEIAERLNSAKKVLLIGHVAPDGDSLGSSIALGRFLRKTGKEVFVACLDRIPPRYEFLLRFSEVITSPESLPRTADYVVVLDCGDLVRTGLPKEYCVEQTFLNIDHHATNKGSLGLAWVDDNYSAVGQQVMHLILALEDHIDSDTATCLYTSLATDSGFFRHSNTTPALLRDAARLLEFGADARLVAEHALERKSLGELCLIRHTLGTLSLYQEDQIALLEVSLDTAQACGVRADEVEEMVEYARAIPGVAVAVLLKEVAPTATKVSLRSTGKADVSLIALQLGGGGHRVAAGATLQRDMAASRALVVTLLSEVLKNA